MGFFLQLLFMGIGIGAVYALVALRFVLIFRDLFRGRCSSEPVRRRHLDGLNPCSISFSDQIRRTPSGSQKRNGDLYGGFVTPASACWMLVGALAKGHEEDQLRGISVPA
jgi:hypothetical protein